MKPDVVINNDEVNYASRRTQFVVCYGKHRRIAHDPQDVGRTLPSACTCEHHLTSGRSIKSIKSDGIGISVGICMTQTIKPFGQRSCSHNTKLQGRPRTGIFPWGPIYKCAEAPEKRGLHRVLIDGLASRR